MTKPRYCKYCKKTVSNYSSHKETNKHGNNKQGMKKVETAGARYSREYRERKKKKLGLDKFQIAETKKRYNRGYSNKELPKTQRTRKIKREIEFVIESETDSDTDSDSDSDSEVEVIIGDIDVSNLDLKDKDLFKYIQDSKKDTTISSSKQQLNRISHMYRLMYDKSSFKMGDLPFIKNTAKVIKWILNKYEKPETIASKFSALSFISKITEGYLPAHTIYEKQLEKYAKKNVEIRDEQKMTEKQKEKFKPLKQIIKWARNSLQLEVHQIQKAVIGIHTLQAPRRAKDYYLMKVVNGTPPDTNFNYLSISNGTMKFYYNKYKTQKTYGQQVLCVVKKLREIIMDYMEDQDIPYGGFLFPKHNTSGSWIKLLKTASEFTTNDFRHIYIIDFLKTKKSLKQKKRLAKLMAHTVKSQNEYDKIY